MRMFDSARDAKHDTQLPVAWGEKRGGGDSRARRTVPRRQPGGQGWTVGRGILDGSKARCWHGISGGRGGPNNVPSRIKGEAHVLFRYHLQGWLRQPLHCFSSIIISSMWKRPFRHSPRADSLLTQMLLSHQGDDDCVLNILYCVYYSVSRQDYEQITPQSTGTMS